MSKKILYLGNNKWCYTENCKQHSSIIASKNRYLAAVENSSEAELTDSMNELMSTPEGLAAYRQIKVKEISKELGRQPMIGLDVDNTSGNFTHGLREWMAKGLSIPQEEWLSHFPEPDEYAMWTGKNAWYKDQKDFLTQFKQAELQGIYKTMQVFDNVPTVLAELKALGFNIQVITARGAEFNDDTRYWMKESVIPARKILNPGNNKHEIKDVDVYLDDSPHVIQTLLAHQKNVVVHTQDYNKDNLPEHENLRRVDGWTEDMVESIFSLLDKKKNNRS